MQGTGPLQSIEVAQKRCDEEDEVVAGKIPPRGAGEVVHEVEKRLDHQERHHRGGAPASGYQKGCAREKPDEGQQQRDGQTAGAVAEAAVGMQVVRTPCCIWSAKCPAK